MAKITFNGVEFYLTDEAVSELKAAKNAREAEAAFERFAPNVPRSHRCGVWIGVDDV